MMYECIILYRNTASGLVGFVNDSEDDVMVFADRDAAIAAADTVPILRAYPYQIVELDEL